MKKETEKITDAMFIVTSEKSCPYYDFGDELIIANHSLAISDSKPICLYLANKLKTITTLQNSSRRPSGLGTKFVTPGSQESKYDCGGCTGMVNFQYLQEKGYVTLQMQLLKKSQEERKKMHLAEFYLTMRKMEIFSSLEDDSLKDLVLLLEFKTITTTKILVKKGASGSHLYIILDGQAAEVDDRNNNISEINSGGILGEFSLLSGEPETNTFQTTQNTQVAMLSVKNFRHILKKHPLLQVFFFKLLINRIQAHALRSGNISSGMAGDINEIPVADLMQLINSSQKTGSIEIVFEEGIAYVYFSEGEIIHATCHKLKGQEAVFSILAIKKGHFTYRKGIPNELELLPIIGGFIGLLMEGIQKIDEDSQQ
jgi:CRP/FNR family cyclic AMP-dependent transcriptional regulator